MTFELTIGYPLSSKLVIHLKSMKNKFEKRIATAI